MVFLLSLFGTVAVQKNILDLEYLKTNSVAVVSLINTFSEVSKLEI